MPRIAYVPREFSDKSLQVIQWANDVCEQYAAMGFGLTLRQLYYQGVSRGLLPNKDTEYKRLGSIINDARLAGLIDWNHLEDRTRNVRELAHWDDPSSILRVVASTFRTDHWANQPFRPIVMIEKDALVGVISAVCEAHDTPYFSCRGYTSQSEMWAMAQRIGGYITNGQAVVILHLGDHDPSGIDMTRDITERLKLFLEYDGFDMELERLALNMDQVQQYNPPPNPAKALDSRFLGYVRIYGYESWELDALEPQVLAGLVENAIYAYIDDHYWSEIEQEIQDGRRRLRGLSTNWSQVSRYLDVEDLVPDV